MDPETEKFRMEHAGMVARSTQGHAAKGMKIKDQEELWVSIQHNTFRNWINVQLRGTGIKVENLSEDLQDGTALITLVESLQKRKLRKVKNIQNQHQALDNVTRALEAIADDGIKLVNIGNVDIVNGNLKLILGLIWSLIVHYQIGQSQVPPKNLMLAWLKGVLPNCEVRNFTTDWNSGVNLGALVDYCRPGSFRHWKNLDPRNAKENCEKAMKIANKEFNIPMILEPEYLSSPYLDDLSGMTYLSYFMREDGPGYKAMLEWIRKTLPEKYIKNFTTDWNDGINLATLIRKVGGSIPGFREMTNDRFNWEENIRKGLEAGKRLGVEPIISAAEMSRPDVEHLGPMAYLSSFQWMPLRKSPTNAVLLKCDLENVRVNNTVPFRLEFSNKDVQVNLLNVNVSGPNGRIPTKIDSSINGAKGSFLADSVGSYEIEVKMDDEVVDGSPHKLRCLPDVKKILFSGIDPCAIGSIVEVVINSNGAGGGRIFVVAHSPTKRPMACPVKEDDGIYTATFTPDEAGEWQIGVKFENEDIQGSPFTCHVYDPNAIKIYNLDRGPFASLDKPFTLIADARACGVGDVTGEITLNKVPQPSKCIEIRENFYEITFTPFEAAKYKVQIYFNGHQVKDSPYDLYIGIQKPPDRKSKKKTTRFKSEGEPIIKEYTSKVESPLPNTFYKSYDSSSRYNSLNRSHDSRLNDINFRDLSTRDYSSLKTTKSSYNKSTENILSKDYSTNKIPSTDYSTDKILSKDYSKTLERFREPTRTLEFEFPSSRTLFDIPLDSTDRSLKKDVKRNSSLTNGYRPAGYSSALDSTFNSSSSNVLNNSGYTSSLKKYTSYEKRTRTNSSSTQSNILSDGVRSPRSSKGFSPMASPRETPVRQFQSRQSPARQMSPESDDIPGTRPGLSSPTQVMHITQTGPRTREGQSLYYHSVTNKKILPSTY